MSRTDKQFSFLASCLGDLQKTGELLDSPLLSDIDEVIKNLPQEKVLGPVELQEISIKPLA